MRMCLKSVAPLLVSLSLLAGCGEGADVSEAPEVGTRTAALLGPGEFSREISSTTDAAGNQTFVTEYAAGNYTLPDGQSGSVASVTIKTFIPATGGTSGSCITSTIEKLEAVPGWTTTVNRAGGCDREIRVEVSNPTTRQKADFSFLMIFGKTRIDSGAIR
ncbi:hypothetical protein KH5H1_76440 [Corallococcus caeni]|uniref:hypothetical protein n=1 Tax=Corallococcus caeni TaxID=3082388 RepID=UPI0029578D27|nr:hypothetical protein KH5H1_76440 [Corallococcus sp. KH5-1]